MDDDVTPVEFPHAEKKDERSKRFRLCVGGARKGEKKTGSQQVSRFERSSVVGSQASKIPTLTRFSSSAFPPSVSLSLSLSGSVARSYSSSPEYRALEKPFDTPIVAKIESSPIESRLVRRASCQGIRAKEERRKNISRRVSRKKYFYSNESIRSPASEPVPGVLPVRNSHPRSPSKKGSDRTRGALVIAHYPGIVRSRGLRLPREPAHEFRVFVGASRSTFRAVPTRAFLEKTRVSRSLPSSPRNFPTRNSNIERVARFARYRRSVGPRVGERR